MQKETEEIIKLTTKEILLTLCDFTAKVFFEQNSFYRQLTKEYLQNREADRIDFSRKIYYLKRQGYIKTFIQNKKRYVELTRKGRTKLKTVSIEKIIIKRPKKWDGKLRVVIFDLPKKFNREREIFREKLKNLFFVRIQKSVYMHPFKCTAEISEIVQRLGIRDYVLVMISDAIQSERKIIEEFIENGILNRSDLTKTKR